VSYEIEGMNRIFLIGYMGAGKSTVGKMLAKRTGLSFIDLDHYIEARFHKTIRELFEDKGEVAFREIEQKMLHEVSMFENVLVSTGGGTPCFFDNISFMNRRGITVYLKVSPEELTKRLELVKHTRPVLKGYYGKKLADFVEENLKKRESFYTQATTVFNAEKMLVETDIDHIVAALEKIV
jgi:shikimate kinase